MIRFSAGEAGLLGACSCYSDTLPAPGSEEKMTSRISWSPGPAAWKDDLEPMPASEWNYDRAAHLLAHAGFGGAPVEIEKLANMGLDRAVRVLVYYESIPNPKMQPFVESRL